MQTENSIRARFVTPVNLDLRTSTAALIQPRVLMRAAFHCPQEN
jgi:hypothetical protein